MESKEYETNNVEAFSELGLFDKLLPTKDQPEEDPEMPKSFIDKVEKEWTTNHIASAMYRQADSELGSNHCEQDDKSCSQ